MATKTIDFTKASGVYTVVVSGGVPRTLYNPNNLLVKPRTNSAVVKISDESWRQTVSMDDTVTEAGVAKSPFADVTALVTYLSGFFHS